MNQRRSMVMVVDDNPLNLSLMEAMLIPAGYCVTLYDSGEKCIEAIPRDAPDIILIDALMPKLDGYQVVRQLKADESTRRIPVVMVTSLEGVAARVEAIEAGADAMLSKPVATVELLAKIRALDKVRTYNAQYAAGVIAQHCSGCRQTQNSTAV